MVAVRASLPTTTSPSSKSTTLGVSRSPSALGTITVCPTASTHATAELVVPRSIPTALGGVIQSTLPPNRAVHRQTEVITSAGDRTKNACGLALGLWAWAPRIKTQDPRPKTRDLSPKTYSQDRTVPTCQRVVAENHLFCEAAT